MNWKTSQSGGPYCEVEKLRAAIHYNINRETFGVVLRLNHRFENEADAMEFAEQMLEVLDDAELTSVQA